MKAFLVFLVFVSVQAFGQGYGLSSAPDLSGYATTASPIFTGSGWIEGRFGVGVNPLTTSYTAKLALQDTNVGYLVSYYSVGVGVGFKTRITSGGILNFESIAGGDVFGLSGAYPNFLIRLGSDGGRVLVNGATDDGHSEVNISGQLRTTVLTAAVTDGAPTASEINTATGLASATAAGAGFETWIKDTDGTSLMYRVVSDGTSWWTYAGTVAP